MGWASGSQLLDEVITAIFENVKSKKVRKCIYAQVIDAFENHDCDTVQECLGSDDAFDEAYYEKYPEDLDEG